MRIVRGQSALPGVTPRQAPARAPRLTGPVLREPLDPPVITALDLSYTSTGVAWLDTLGYVGVTTITTAPAADPYRWGLDLAQRRLQIRAALGQFIAPQTLIVREARIDNLDVVGSSALDLAALHGMVEDLAASTDAGHPLASVNLQRLKVFGANSGRANKAMMVEAAQREFAGLVTVVNDDEADALWLLALACMMHDLPMARITKRRAETVAACRATWPTITPALRMPARLMTRIRSTPPNHPTPERA